MIKDIPVCTIFLYDSCKLKMETNPFSQFIQTSLRRPLYMMAQARARSPVMSWDCIFTGLCAAGLFSGLLLGYRGEDIGSRFRFLLLGVFPKAPRILLALGGAPPGVMDMYLTAALALLKRGKKSRLVFERKKKYKKT